MDQTFSKWQPTVLSLFRFITGLLLLQFGIAKIFKFPAMPYFAELPPLDGVTGTAGDDPPSEMRPGASAGSFTFVSVPVTFTGFWSSYSAAKEWCAASPVVAAMRAKPRDNNVGARMETPVCPAIMLRRR